MDYLTSLTNDEIMIQEKLKLVSLRKTIYSYLNYYNIFKTFIKFI